MHCNRPLHSGRFDIRAATIEQTVSDLKSRKQFSVPIGLSAAKVLVAQSARYVGQQAVQLHGGIGVTDELAVSHHFKRLTMISLLFGDIDHHLALFGEQLAA